MWARYLMLVVLSSSSILYFSKLLSFSDIIGSALFGWLFIFSYLMTYVLLITAVFFAVFDSMCYLKTKSNDYRVFLGFDTIIPVVNYLIFDGYYRLIS